MSDEMTTGTTGGIVALLELMTRLRDPEAGCPWDKIQTFRTIAPYTIEEAYEVADAIDRDDLTALRDELGDLLLQVVFHAEMARERGAFDFDDVVRGITGKMHRRHPHVFGRSTESDLGVLNRIWEQHKAGERAAVTDDGTPPGTLDGVARALPALMRAQKLQRRAARVGFDWPEPGAALAKIDEELAEVREALARGAGAEETAGEIGDLLFACVNAARHLDIDAEAALRGCNEKFTRRFNHVEAGIAKDGKRVEDASLEEMEAFWIESKGT